MRLHIFFPFYVAVVFFALLHPLNFDFNTTQPNWIGNENGIRFEQKGQIISLGDVPGLYQNLTNAKGLTLEVWLKTDDVTQDGPARILSYSIDLTQRNFTLAQSEDRLVIRIRTENTDLNGVYPHMAVPNVFETALKTHVVVTYDFEEQCVHINGESQTCDRILQGNFSNWDPSFKLAIGNEVSGDRPWTGEIYYAAIYDQALDRKAIIEKFHAEAKFTDYFGKRVRTHPSPTVQYLFNEKNGQQVMDTGLEQLEIHLHISNALTWANDFWNFRELSKVKDSLLTIYSLAHALLFFPFGFYAHRILSIRVESFINIVWVTLIFGFLISFGTEFLQYFLPSRTSSIADIISNLIGLSLGLSIGELTIKLKKPVKAG